MNPFSPTRILHARLLICCLLAWTFLLIAAASHAAQITLSNLTQTYNGTPRPVTVITNPPGLKAIVTYAGSNTAPTNAGTYSVSATIDDPVESGSASGSLVIQKASQTITFNTLSSKTYGDAPFQLAATSSSGLPISYTSSVTTVATVSGSTVTITGAGDTFIRANQAGDLNYLAATQVNRALKVNKKSLTFSLVLPTGKTYGDPPFTVSATVSGGLSIAKWESADPSVATVSPTGLVTIVGAGQTSIIASIPSSDSPNYDPAWIAKPLNVARSAAPLPSGTRTVSYNGSAHGLDPATLPSGLATEITYRDINLPEPPPTPQVVFQNGPDTLTIHQSTAVQANGLSGMAKFVNLGGTARKLHSCDVTLAAYSRYDSSSPYGRLSWANANPSLVVPPTPGISIPGNSGGWYHPVTLAIYDYFNDGVTERFRLLTSQTVLAFIPWRPEKYANGSNYTYQSYPFRVPFTFPDGVILPQEVWVAVSFNTQSYGANPIGLDGPYNELNICYPEAQLVGSDIFGNLQLLFKNWRWLQASGVAGPMLRLRAVPTNASPVAPTNASTYEVKTQATAFGGDGPSSSILVINKAPLDISLSNLTQIRDGNPRPVTVHTTPPGIAITKKYGLGLSPVPPTDPGTYPVTAVSADPNYDGQANATLRIGDTFASWQAANFRDSGLPTEQITDTADPDGDGLGNFLEYAANLNPLLGNDPPATGLDTGEALSFNYRRNPHALDIQYRIQGTGDLGDPSSWTPVTPLSETAVCDDGGNHFIQATLQKPAHETSYFLRLQCSRIPEAD